MHAIALEAVSSSSETPAVPERINGVPITPRQREIVGLIADGLTDREMAELLSIRLETLKSHVRALKIRTRARNRPHLVALAFRDD